MEQTREEALGAPGAPQRPQKPLTGPKPSLDPRHDAKKHQSEPQELHKQGRGGYSRQNAASRGGQTTSGTASSFDSSRGTIPVSVASHASVAFLSSKGAQPHPPSFTLPPIANRQPHNGVAPDSNHGQRHVSASISADVQRSVAPASAAQPTSVLANGTHARPPNPAADAHSSTLAPETAHPIAKHSTQTASSADARKSLPSLITSAPAVNARVGSNSSRQPGSSGSDFHGSTTSQSPVGQLSADSPPVSKPIMKMKRTGQNFPISSPRSSSPLRAPASLHQRKGPSPNRKTAVLQGSSSLSKEPENPHSRGLGLPTTVNGSIIGEKKGSNRPAQLPIKCRTNTLDCQYKVLTCDIANENSTHGRSTKESIVEPETPLDGLSRPASRSKTGVTPVESLPTGHLTESVPRSARVPDESSDDEIKYETAPKTVVSDDALEAEMEDDTSDNDTASGGDDEEALELTSSHGAGASPRQLFYPPEESDYGDDDNDDTVSSSSSSESSHAADEEPVVALPSANIQHEQDYPEHILETAKSGRPYHTWFGE